MYAKNDMRLERRFLSVVHSVSETVPTESKMYHHIRIYTPVVQIPLLPLLKTSATKILCFMTATESPSGSMRCFDILQEINIPTLV